MEQGKKSFKELLQEKLLNRKKSDSIPSTETKVEEPKSSEEELRILCRELEEKIERYSNDLDKLYGIVSNNLKTISKSSEFVKLSEEFQAVYNKIFSVYKKAVDEYQRNAIRYLDINNAHRKEIFSLEKANNYSMNMERQTSEMLKLTYDFIGASIEILYGNGKKYDEQEFLRELDKSFDNEAKNR